MDKHKSIFTFEQFQVEKINYFANSDFKASEPIDIRCSFDVNVTVHETLPKGKVSIKTKVFDNPVQNNFPFSLEVIINGYFSMEDSPIAMEEFKKLCEINGTAALFPFVRSAIADITKAANIQPLMLPLINIHNLIEEQKLQKNKQKENINM